MGIEKIIFYMFAAMLIGSSMLVITAKNMVRAVLALILSFFCAAVLWMLLEAEFLSITLVLVYVGAVMVLFLFVVMMLDVDEKMIEMKARARLRDRYMPFALLVVVMMASSIALVVGPENFGLAKFAEPMPNPADYSNIKTLGLALYTDYLVGFELAAVILLVAIVAAISLTFRGGQARKSQSVHKQVLANKAERLRVVEMPAESPNNKRAD